ncbi:fluoride ion transporter CrcB [Terasakiispira papahanaumokuakeensis]|uniref:Fluoride-specific ion channel FluC n=1 Tax=Terasakiispira papahanaumokuakeensis TaxID=197479 RepID=A0A1E2VD50_9GAMM|nr:fluoride efflux transporter CrcB [Terasakiispira papahanaumokuakeensis]ODC04873.1 fluoride ion transporter CrcB [Terasakiispira papahanaumokuakeensis]
MNLPASLLAITAGAGIGASTRWWLSLRLNAVLSHFPLGTLVANLTGAWLIGIALGWLTNHPELPDFWRLFLVTGLLGALTTFSTFSAEVANMLQQGRLTDAALTIGLHLAGSVMLTLAGFWCYDTLAGG